MACARCGLTPRSSGAPTAGHQARSGGTRYIFASPGLASCRRHPLSSNVRQHKNEVSGVSGRKCGAQRRGSNSHDAPSPRAAYAARSIARQRAKPNEAVRAGREATAQLSVVSGQRFAASSYGPRSRDCQLVLGARRRPQRRGSVQVGPRRQASSWHASLVSAERLALVPLHQSQLPQWHTTRLPVTAHCAA